MPEGGVVPACSVPLYKAESCTVATFGDTQVDLALAAQERAKRQGSSLARSKSARDKCISEGHIALVPQTQRSVGAPSQWAIRRQGEIQRINTGIGSPNDKHTSSCAP